MKRTPRCLVLLLAPLASAAPAQELLLSGWNDSRNVDATPNGVFTQYSPNLPDFPADQWLAPVANGGSPSLGSDIGLEVVTNLGVTEGASALKLTQDGSNRGGADTHYNFSTGAYFHFAPIGPFAADPRGTALADAVTSQATTGGRFGNSLLVDVTLDLETMVERNPADDSLVNWPVDGSGEPTGFFGFGFYMGGRGRSDTGVNLASTGYDWVSNELMLFAPFDDTFEINGVEYAGDASDAPGSTPVAPVTVTLPIRFPDGESFKTNLWTILNNTVGSGAGQAIELGFVMNGNWSFGTSQSVYIDNLRLVTVDRLADALDRIDRNDNGVADMVDYETFLNDFLANVTDSDSDGWFDGDINQDGLSTIADLTQFERDFDFVADILGGLSLAKTVAGVPEPGAATLLLALGAMLGCSRRGRRAARAAVPTALAALVVACPAQAQTGTVWLLESWEGQDNPFEQSSLPQEGSLAVVTNAGIATDGSKALRITQAGEFDESNIDQFLPHALGQYGAGTPQYAAIESAVSLGSDLFRLKLDVVYRNADLPFVDSVVVPLAIGSGAGFNRVGAAFDDAQGLWQAGDGDKTVTIDLPLSAFDPLGDSEVISNGQYQIEIGLGGLQTFGAPFSVYFDNLRLKQVADPQLLKINVDRGTGEVTLTNPTATPIDISYYEVRSGNGALARSAWTSLDDAEGADSVGQGWDEVPASNDNLLAEVVAQFGGQGPVTIASGAALSLGPVFDGQWSVEEDLIFQYRTNDRPNKLIGNGDPTSQEYLVNYTGAALPTPAVGDYNLDGVVDAADYVVWRDTVGSETVTLADGNDDGVIDELDRAVWASNYGAAFVPPASGVPEPLGLSLALMGVTAATPWRRRSCRSGHVA